MQVIFIIGFIALIAGFIIYSWYADKKRREALQQIAASLNLSFHKDDPYNISSKYDYFDALHTGSRRYAFNILKGAYTEHDILAFDYHYETYSTDSKGNRQTHHHYFSGVVLHLPKSFPELRVRPEGFFDKLGALVGFDDIDFESLEFSKKYMVKSKNKKFAYDIFHTRMMEYFLNNTGIVMEIERDAMIMIRNNKMNPENIRGRLDSAVKIRSLMPDYLIED